ncbi:hypothetical protein D3C80_1780420 [compost metagenome]
MLLSALKAIIFILSNEFKASFCSVDNFVLSTFKMFGEISKEINSFFSEFSTKYFCSEGSELQLPKVRRAVSAKMKILVLIFIFCL